MKKPGILALRPTAITAAAFVLFSTYSLAQEGAPAAASQPSDASVRDLDSQVRELRAVIEQMRTENAQSRAEMRELRQELQDTRKLLAPLTASTNVSPSSAATESTLSSEHPATAATPVSPAAADLGSRVQRLEESTQLLGSRINEQYQTKVETASKYRTRLSGIVLMNAFHNVGASDNLDFPEYAQPAMPGTSQTSFGATLRQSEIGLEIFGPNVAGAKSSANLQFDFFGGFPATNNGVNFGVARMQTASVRLDWKNTSVIAGQDSLFISPLSPTSFASLALPAFDNAGNLWGWTPQLRVEHRFDLTDRQTLTLQGGILDNLDWETANSSNRMATSGESTGQPAYAMRTAWSRPVYDHPLTFAVAGYYGRQNWGFGHYVDAWAGMTDWQVPITRRLNLSGEFYRGRGVGGLGAAIGQTILWGGNPVDVTTPIHGIDSAGGWTQLKFQLTRKLEINGVLAEDDAFASHIRGFSTDADNFGTPILGRNRGSLFNLVYRPRSDLLLSAEFRRLHTFPVYDSARVTNQVNLAMGILF